MALNTIISSCLSLFHIFVFLQTKIIKVVKKNLCDLVTSECHIETSIPYFYVNPFYNACFELLSDLQILIIHLFFIIFSIIYFNDIEVNVFIVKCEERNKLYQYTFIALCLFYLSKTEIKIFKFLMYNYIIKHLFEKLILPSRCKENFQN